MPSGARQPAAEGETNMSIRNTVISLLLSACLCSTPLPVTAAENDGKPCGDSLTWSYDGAGTLTISGTGDMWDFRFFDDYCCFQEGSIDTEYYDQKDADAVEGGDPPWARYQYLAKRVCIGEGVTSIGKDAFYCFYNLLEVSLPSTLSKIGYEAFSGCTMLENVTFPEGLTEIGAQAFSECSLKEISIPGTVRSIGHHAFSWNYYLRSAELNEGLESIGDSCFADCYRLKDINFPSTLTRIGNNIMENDGAWLFEQKDKEFVTINGWYLYRYFGEGGDIVIPDSIRELDTHCFYEASFYTYWGDDYSSEDDFPDLYEWDDFPDDDGYMEAYDVMRFDIDSITLPDSITVLKKGQFADHWSLQRLHIGAGITEIPADFCSGCGSLQIVELPEGLLKIGSSAFQWCRELTDINFPDSLEDVDSTAFPDAPFIRNFGDWVVIGKGILMKYQGMDRVVTVPEGVRLIASDAFYESKAVSVTLSSTVQNLSARAFRSDMLVELTLNDELESIPAGVIIGSKSFRTLRIPAGVTDINPYCYKHEMVFTVIGEAGSEAEAFAEETHMPFRTAEIREGEDMTLDPAKDCWSFKNNSSVFSSQNYLTDADRALLEEYNLKTESAWGGACFGMCATIILAKNGLFSADMIKSGASSIGELEASPKVQSMINFFQCLQQTDEFRLGKNTEHFEQCVFEMIRIAEEIPNGESPFMICFDTTGGGRHAVVGYGTEEGSWFYNDREWNHRILVYDPNKVSFMDECCLYYDPVTLSVSIPQYGFYWDAVRSGNWLYLRTCNNLHVLNVCSYPFAERFAPDLLKGDLNADGSLTAEDAELMLDYLLCRTEPDAAQTARVDLSGDGRLTAADLTLLKQKLLVRRPQPAAA